MSVMNDNIQITDAILASMRDSLRELGFQEILPAILSSRFEPGARHSVAVLGNQSLPKIEKSESQEDGSAGVTVSGARHYYLPVSHCVEKQLALEHAERVFCLAPCLRLLMEGESNSGRHLYTFHQIEVELRTEAIDEVFDAAEKILQGFSNRLVANLPDPWKDDKATRERIHILSKVPYPRVSFAEARAMVTRSGAGETNPHNPNDLTHDEEEELAQRFDTPFWLYDYPEGVRDCPFHKNERDTYDTLDLMLPSGFGELSTGGIRPHSAEEIVRLSRTLGDEVFHPDYAEWKDSKRVQTGGFGFGLERLIRYCAGYESILSARQPHDSGPNATIELEK